MAEQRVIVSVIGARPQFIKAAPVELELAQNPRVVHYSIHTGQHYDANMSEIFFNQLHLQRPYINLESGSGSHAAQTAAMMERLEKVYGELNPDLVLVYGDTNSTLAGALVAAKMNIPVAHIEAGLRSYNKSMPEEINRILTDHMSSLLFVPTEAALANLRKEGIMGGIETGDVMMDMLHLASEEIANSSPVRESFIYTTLHRPYNTDDPERLFSILDALNNLQLPVYFPVHPRTRNLLADLQGNYQETFSNIHYLDPQGYFENLRYLKYCTALVTDSGGMQKEAYFLERKCVTIRSETEWTETLENACNTLVWEELSEIGKAVEAPYGPFKRGIYGDGHAAKQIVSHLYKYLGI